MWWAITSLGYLDEGLLNYGTILHCTLSVVLKCKFAVRRQSTVNCMGYSICLTPGLIGPIPGSSILHHFGLTGDNDK